MERRGTRRAPQRRRASLFPGSGYYCHRDQEHRIHLKIISRYLLKEHVGPFAFALGALTGLLLLNQVARRFGDLVGKGLPWSLIASVFGLSIPFIIAMTLPMACLVAVLQAFSRLGADAEVTALKASGVNIARVMRPVLVAFTLIGAFEFLFLDRVLPPTNHQLKNLLVDIARKKPTFELREQAVNAVVPGQLFLRAGRIDQATDLMRDVVIYDLANPTRRRTIYADSGYIRFNADRTDLFLTLYSGYIHDYDRAESATFRRIFFTSDLVRVGNVSNRLERTGENDYRGDREMSLCEMERVVTTALGGVKQLEAERRRAIEKDALGLVGVVAPPGDTARPALTRRSLTALYCRLLDRISGSVLPAAVQAQTPARRPRIIETSPRTPRDGTQPLPIQRPRQLVAGDLEGTQLRSSMATLEAQRQASMRHAAGFQVEIHKKYSLAVACIVFVLIGAPLALRFPRGGVGMVIGASVAIFGFYYIGLIGGESLADRRVIPPFWAMWTPNMLMAIAGIILFLRLGHERTTSRGGSAVEWLRRRFTRAKPRSA